MRFELNKKTCWMLGVATGALELICGLLPFTGYMIPALVTFTLLAQGCLLLLLATAEKSKKRQLILLLGALLVLLGAMSTTAYTVCTPLAWVLCIWLYRNETPPTARYVALAIYLATAVQLATATQADWIVRLLLAVVGALHLAWCLLMSRTELTMDEEDLAQNAPAKAEANAAAENAASDAAADTEAAERSADAESDKANADEESTSDAASTTEATADAGTTTDADANPNNTAAQ